MKTAKIKMSFIPGQCPRPDQEVNLGQNFHRTMATRSLTQKFDGFRQRKSSPGSILIPENDADCCIVDLGMAVIAMIPKNTCSAKIVRTVVGLLLNFVSANDFVLEMQPVLPPKWVDLVGTP